MQVILFAIFASIAFGVTALPLTGTRATSFVGQIVRLLSVFAVATGFYLIFLILKGEANTKFSFMFNLLASLVILIVYLPCWLAQVFTRRGLPLVEAVLSFLVYYYVYTVSTSLVYSLGVTILTALIVGVFTTRIAPIKEIIQG